MRLLIFGGRDYDDIEEVERWVLLIRPSLVISGFATGADILAFHSAKKLGYPQIIFPANWVGEQKGAGFARNQRMIDEGRPDFGLGFPGGKGTEDMWERLGKAGIRRKRAWGRLI